MGTGGGGRHSTQGPPSYRVWGEGETRATALVLHTFEMHVSLSFSYLHFAEAASFDKKELRRSCTKTIKKSENYSEARSAKFGNFKITTKLAMK